MSAGAELVSPVDRQPSVIIWMNGTFGAGKTTTAEKLVARSDRLRLFDPEWVGHVVRANLTDHEHTDFQEFPPRRALVPVQTVLDESYWREIHDGLVRRGHQVRHVLLDVEEGPLRIRIDADLDGTAIRPWRHDHVEPYLTARRWLTSVADLVVDTTSIDAAEAATRIAAHLEL